MKTTLKFFAFIIVAASVSSFGTDQDDSNPTIGRYYVTRNNLPWGLNTVDKFNYPAEKVPINLGFTKFIPWSLSSGREYYDWFHDKKEYRNSNMLYY